MVDTVETSDFTNYRTVGTTGLAGGEKRKTSVRKQFSVKPEAARSLAGRQFTVIVEQLDNASPGAFLSSDYKCVVCRDKLDPIDEKSAFNAAARAIEMKPEDCVLDRGSSRYTLGEDFKPVIEAGRAVRPVKYACVEFLISKKK